MNDVAKLFPYLDSDGHIMFRGLVGQSTEGVLTVSKFFPCLVDGVVMLRGMGRDGVQYGYLYDDGELMGRTRFNDGGLENLSCVDNIRTYPKTIWMYPQFDAQRHFWLYVGPISDHPYELSFAIDEHDVPLSTVVGNAIPQMYSRMRCGIPLTIEASEDACPCTWSFYEAYYPILSEYVEASFDTPPMTASLTASVTGTWGNYWTAYLQFYWYGATKNNTSYGVGEVNSLRTYTGTFRRGTTGWDKGQLPYGEMQCDWSAIDPIGAGQPEFYGMGIESVRIA